MVPQSTNVKSVTFLSQITFAVYKTFAAMILSPYDTANLFSAIRFDVKNTF